MNKKGYSFLEIVIAMIILTIIAAISVSFLLRGSETGGKVTDIADELKLEACKASGLNIVSVSKVDSDSDGLPDDCDPCTWKVSIPGGGDWTTSKTASMSVDEFYKHNLDNDGDGVPNACDTKFEDSSKGWVSGCTSQVETIKTYNKANPTNKQIIRCNLIKPITN